MRERETQSTRPLDNSLLSFMFGTFKHALAHEQQQIKIICTACRCALPECFGNESTGGFPLYFDSIFWGVLPTTRLSAMGMSMQSAMEERRASRSTLKISVVDSNWLSSVPACTVTKQYGARPGRGEEETRYNRVRSVCLKVSRDIEHNRTKRLVQVA
jgi:hypothetical protein